MFHWHKYHNGQPAQTSCVNLFIEGTNFLCQPCYWSYKASGPSFVLWSFRPFSCSIKLPALLLFPQVWRLKGCIHESVCFRWVFSEAVTRLPRYRKIVATKIYIMQQNCMNIVKFPRLFVVVSFITRRKDNIYSVYSWTMVNPSWFSWEVQIPSIMVPTKIHHSGTN